jgi:hypothetical protein
VLVLAAANLLGVTLFGTLYVVAGLRYMSQAAFLACLAVLFAVVTALWLRVEAHHQHLRPARRFGSVAAGLVAVVIVVPIAVLVPVFWLDAQLPVEAGLHSRLGAVMVVVLIALVLILLVNVAGGVVIALRFVLARGRA